MKLVRPLVATLVAVALAVPFASMGAHAAVCPGGLREMEDVGTVCPREGGLYEVFSPEMRSLGTIHGSDPVPAAPESGFDTLAAAPPVTCVSGAPGTYFIQVIYARATDDLDGYASWLPRIRAMVNDSNRLVNDAAIATGSTAALQPKCVAGLVEVKNEALPTTSALASFSTITDDLYDRGYNSGRVKYWVFYDDTGACSCGGQGNIYGDDSLSVANANNGNAGAMYAINYGYDSTRIWLHELGHNLGAVQLSAPHTSGGWHCNDGRDTMCYNDGGSNSSGYSTSFCAVEIWDCGRDSYFNAKPAAGSYLASHWNLGNAIVRYMTLGAPSLNELACAPDIVELGNATTCTFRGFSSASGVRYRIDWGDGAVIDAPASGFVASGTQLTAARTYTTTGIHDILVTIGDSAGATGNTLADRVDVRDDLTPPVITLLEPVRDTIYQGCDDATLSPVHIARPIFLQRGCVKADAFDTHSGVARVEVFVAGGLVGVDTTPPYVFEFDVKRPQLNTPVWVYAYDAAGNRAYAIAQVDLVGFTQ